MNNKDSNGPTDETQLTFAMNESGALVEGSQESPRRRFLTGLAALGAGALMPGCETTPLTANAKPHRIDIHHHLLPPAHIKEIVARRSGATPAWSPANSIEDMDKNGVATSILSATQPGVWFDDIPTGRRLSRIINEYGAQMMRDYPGRFGLFAVIPLPDIEGSLREIEYAMDTLKADGIGLMTSYGNRWLGDASFAPVWQELNRRRAVVYNHPLIPDCCGNIKNDTPVSVIEYAADTSRTISSLIFSGTAARYPNISWIHSHGGGAVPFVLDRFTYFEAGMKPDVRQRTIPNGLLYELKKFYYDTAQASHPGALAAMMALASESHMMFGSDYPLRSASVVVQGLSAYKFSTRELAAIERENALRLIPRLKA